MRVRWDTLQILLTVVTVREGSKHKLNQGEMPCALSRGASISFKMAARDLKRAMDHLSWNGAVREGRKGGALKGVDVKGHMGDLSPLGLLFLRLLRSFWRSLGYAGR